MESIETEEFKIIKSLYTILLQGSKGKNLEEAQRSIYVSGQVNSALWIMNDIIKSAVDTPTLFNRNYKTLLFILKALKMLCVNSFLMQDLLKQEEVMRKLSDFVEQLLKDSSNYLQDESSAEKIDELLKEFLGFSVNFITNNETNQEYCFGRIASSKPIVNTSMKTPITRRYFAIFVYNYMKTKSEHVQTFINSKYGRSLLKKMIYHYNKSTDENDYVYWVHLIFKLLLTQPSQLLLPLLNELKSSKDYIITEELLPGLIVDMQVFAIDKNELKAFTSRQISLLMLISELFEADESENKHELISTDNLILISRVYEWQASQFVKFYMDAVLITLAFTGSNAELERAYENAIQGLAHIIEVFCVLTSKGNEVQETQDLLINHSVLETSMRLSRSLDFLFTVLKKMKKSKDDEIPMTKSLDSFLSKLIRLVSNLCHKNGKAAHFFVENKEYLFLLLNFTKLDFDNPLLREWSLFGIRHLCEVSEEIRKSLESMKPVEIDANTQQMMREKGIDISFNKDTMKFEVKTNR